MYYYELDLRGFGYRTLGELGKRWLSEDRRQRIMSAVAEGLRYDDRFWFDHGHLHGGNILIKLDKQGEIFDARIIDFSVLRKIDLQTSPLLQAVHAKKENVKVGPIVEDINFEWMDLKGWDFSDLDLKYKYFNGSNLTQRRIALSQKRSGSASRSLQ